LKACITENHSEDDSEAQANSPRKNSDIYIMDGAIKEIFK